MKRGRGLSKEFATLETHSTDVKRSHGKSLAGFTIVETLIFLAVSSALLVSALTLVSGSQNKAEFSQAINDINQKIIDIYNNVSTGYYPYTSDARAKTCTVSGSVIVFSNSGSEQGASKDCIFVGRAIRFTTDKEYQVYTLAAKREESPGRLVTDYDANTGVKVVSDSNNANFPDLTENFELRNGLTLKKATHNSNQIRGIAFMSTLGDEDPTKPGQVTSGSQIARLGHITGSRSLDTDASFITDIESQIKNTAFFDDGTIELCFESGGTNQHATITLGTLGQQTATNLAIAGGSC